MSNWKSNTLFVLLATLLFASTAYAAQNKPNTSTTYAMSYKDEPYDDAYANYFGAWGYYALRWKAHKAIDNDINATYEPSMATNVPSEYVTEGDHVPLDDNEADFCVFPAGDPSGTWDSLTANAAKELFVGAAIYMERWGSPVFANLRRDTTDITEDPRAAVIRSVTLSKDVATLCPNWDDSITPGVYEVPDIARACIMAVSFGVEEVEIGFWDADTGYSITNEIVTGWNDILELPAPSGFGNFTYVGDPIDKEVDEANLVKQKQKGEPTACGNPPKKPTPPRGR